MKKQPSVWARRWLANLRPGHLGAALATIVVLESPNHSLAIDPNAIGRVVQGILTGIGFLGAGVILRDPKGHVTGLTTAATIWIWAVLGIVCGLGYWCRPRRF
jgi:putative Mg2+ transporter-C (MgtC) family protein